MFDLRACFYMGWVSYVDFNGAQVRLTLTNGKTLTYSRAEFGRLYRY